MRICERSRSAAEEEQASNQWRQARARSPVFPAEARRGGREEPRRCAPLIACVFVL
jgi:hypothetical protein